MFKMPDLTMTQGSDKVDLPKKPKRTITKLTFQPMVGGIRRTVYMHKISDIINALEQIFKVLPENHALRLDVKVLNMEKDEHLKKLIPENVERGSEFESNKKVGDQVAQMCGDDKENKI
jgi:hypothetical protein